jgi:hypothetical protein
MENKDNSERIERYLREQMTPEENDAFLNELRNDKDLREEAQMMALMIKGMKEEQARQDAEVIEGVRKGLAAASIGLGGTTPSSPAPKPQIFTLRRIFSIAAIFILIFGASLLWNKQSDSEALFNEYYSSYTLQGTSRGCDSDVEKELAILFDQVGTTEDITPVINKLQTIYDSIDSEYEYSLYADDITWYLALAYLKDGKPEKAKELLKPLADNGNDLAIKLLNAIEK